MRIFRYTLTVLLVFHSFISLAQKGDTTIYTIKPDVQLHDLGVAAIVLADPVNKLTIEDLSRQELNARFVSLTGFSQKVEPYTTYWIKIPVLALTDIKGWRLVLWDSLYSYYTRTCYADVYIVNEKNEVVQHEQTGLFVPRSQRSIGSDPGINQVLFSATTGKQTIYIKIYNEFDAETGRLPVPELRQPQLEYPTPYVGMLFSILSAIAVIFSVISFFFYFFVREKAYLLFALYTLALSQHYLILHPEALFIGWYIPEHPHWATSFFNVLAPGGFVFFLWFGDMFTNLKQLSLRLHRLLMWFIAVFGSLLLVEGVIMGITHRYFLNPYLNYIGLLIVLVFVVRFAFFKNILSRLYVTGAAWLCLFTVIGLMYNRGTISFPFNPWPIGQVGQLLIYAAGLAYKIRLNEKARAEAARIKDMDDIKSTFFANISHEFRTPLTLIQGPLQQLEEMVKKDGKANATVPVSLRQLQTMRRNTDRLLELVNQLLDLSRLDSGKMKLQIIKGDVLQLLKSLAASFDSMAERKQIHYHIHFSEQTRIAFFDKDKLEKIFTNLLGNAFKYTPERGTVSVIVEIEDNRIRFSVEDNGPGIAKKELDKVFDRFYRAEGAGDKGSGIGLALVKELVNLYRGQVSVSSEPAKGSRFRISLPCGKDAFKEEEMVYGEWKNEESFISKNIYDADIALKGDEIKPGLPLLLIVEDSDDLRNFIKETVQDQYNTTEAVNGKQGLEKAFAEVPDIIVSDVMMPQMDGFAMTTAIKKNELSSHIPIILLTAKAGSQHKIEGLETGADDYLTKPFDAKELLARLQNLINQRKLLRKKFAGSIRVKPSEIAVKSVDEIFLVNLMELIETNMEEDDFGVEELAKKAAMSRSQLHRKLVALLDKSPSDLIRQTRLLRAKELLQKKAFTPSEVAFKVGFNSHTYFSKCFKEEFGITPGEVM